MWLSASRSLTELDGHSRKRQRTRWSHAVSANLNRKQFHGRSLVWCVHSGIIIGQKREKSLAQLVEGG